MENKIKVCLGIMDDLNTIYESEANWEVKYHLIFRGKNKLLPHLQELGLSLEWYDPDTSYQQDVSSFMLALKELRRSFQSIHANFTRKQVRGIYA